MMDFGDVTNLYGEQYQRDSVSEPALKAWEKIASKLTIHFPQPNWVDVGCGGGGLLLALQKLGKQVWGIEGSTAALNLLPGVGVVVHDLRTPLPVFWRSDVVTCFDVAEHVGAAENLVDILTDLARCYVVFGAAPPGQDGHGHIDLRPHDEWTTLFAKRGWVHLRSLSEEIRYELRKTEGVNFLWWVEKNLHVYTLGSPPLRRPVDLARFYALYPEMSPP